MTNPYGITLNRVWTEWATNYGVSSTVAAALFLISVHRPAHEVAAKLTTCEFKQVIDIVRRWPNNFAAGTLAALESHKHVAASTSTDASGRPPAGIEDTRRTHECRFGSNASQTAPQADGFAPDQRAKGPFGWRNTKSLTIIARMVTARCGSPESV
jgi:hypothetical protein